VYSGAGGEEGEDRVVAEGAEGVFEDAVGEEPKDHSAVSVLR